MISLLLAIGDVQAVSWIAHLHFMDALTNLSFNYNLLTSLQQNIQRTSSCPRFGTRALIGGRRSVSVSTKSYRRWQQQLGVVKTQYFGTGDTGLGLDDQVKQEPLGIMIFKTWFSGASSVLQSSSLQ